jgi:ATP synthase protein I
VDDRPPQPARPDATLAEQVGIKASRKLKAKRHAAPGVWFGLGMMGLIGWSVVVPTLLGTAAGMWLDRHYPAAHAWTLALLVAGLTLGCANAWHWIAMQDRSMHDEKDEWP